MEHATQPKELGLASHAFLRSIPLAFTSVSIHKLLVVWELLEVSVGRDVSLTVRLAFPHRFVFRSFLLVNVCTLSLLYVLKGPIPASPVGSC